MARASSGVARGVTPPSRLHITLMPLTFWPMSESSCLLMGCVMYVASAPASAYRLARVMASCGVCMRVWVCVGACVGACVGGCVGGCGWVGVHVSLCSRPITPYRSAL
jgi:hypothetical protein